MKKIVWKKLGNVDIKNLVGPKLQLHYASQLVAVVGFSLLPHQKDYSHISLQWDDKNYAFLGQQIPATKPFRAALRLNPLSLLILDLKGNEIANLPLNKITIGEALKWLESKLPINGDKKLADPLAKYGDNFPKHPLKNGGKFNVNYEAFDELARYYSNTYKVLNEIITKLNLSYPIYVWPHHFDMAVLIPKGKSKDNVEKSVGLGFSPGDNSYPEPYWYVLPWPKPELKDIPSNQEVGFWHREGWVGAVLLASSITEEAVTQNTKVSTFFDINLNKSIEILKDL